MAEKRRQRPWLWTEAVCNRCSGSGPGRHVRANHIGTRAATKAVEKEAIGAGWVADHDGEWTCPICLRAPGARQEGE